MNFLSVRRFKPKEMEIVQDRSTNLTSWTAISTNLADSTSMTFTNATTLSRRFFRLLERP